MNNSLTFITTLDEANLAAQQQNWFQVQYYLQQLCFSKTLDGLEPDIWQKVLNLALEVLFKGDFPQKWGIAKLFPVLGKQVVMPLVTILEDEAVDPEVHWFAVRILGEFKEPVVVIALAELLQTTEEEDLASIASRTLAHIGKPAIEVLTNLLEQPKYRLFAVRSLAHIRSPQTITALLKATQDPQPEIRAIAIEALGSFHEDPIPYKLITALKDTSSLVRKEAVAALGYRQDIATELDLIEHLQPLLYDLNSVVCHQTAIALGRMQHQKSATALFRVLQSPHTPFDLQLTIVRALGWSEIELALDYLQQALPEAEKLVCQEIIAVLGRILEPKLKAKATNILIDFANAYPDKINEYQLKAVLATSLGELGQATARDTLKQLETDPEPKIKLHAIAALKKLGR
ncbi:MAG: HEAT repeat domain-containing protein [Xenococcaceae cyanobacterium MO_234.B1]|nr:HEAT repeat domain-containing protein [Xenococcaceae cyanobacterium MO_234.B1]